MYKIEVNGGRPLAGSLYIQGAKNAVLPILAATVLGKGESVIHGCPALSDVDCTIAILKHAGCRIRREDDTVCVDASLIKENIIPDAFMQKMRSSIIFLGALAARCGSAEMSFPGGCELGPRPIDLHMDALQKIGVGIQETGGMVRAVPGRYAGGRVHLDFPSVGATENLMLAATLAKGETILTNAAKEPEICDLQTFLQKMGAKVEGAGTDTIRIEGVKRLYGAEHTVMPDRIAGATYLCADILAGGEMELRGANPAHMQAILAAMRGIGADVRVRRDQIYIKAPARPLPIKLLRTMPYPGFPTDAQALMSAVLSVADGTSVVEENIFENRFKHCEALCRMGADITIHGRAAVIRGVRRLTGARVEAAELRGGAALVIAGLGAEGKTTISGTRYIDRGYAALVSDLHALGADIRKV